MYRTTCRICPACRNEMEETPLVADGEQVVIDICRRCGAVYFDLADGTPGILARAIGPELGSATTTAEVGAPITEPRCPDCEQVMVPHTSLNQVFRCDSCCSVLCRDEGVRGLASACAVYEPRKQRTFSDRLLDLILGRSG